MIDGKAIPPFTEARTKARTEAKAEATAQARTEATTTTTPASLSRRYIPPTIRRQVFERDQGRCTFVDPVTHRKCESKHLLEVDHIKPLAHRGSSEVANLRLLCRAHNQLAATQKFSRAKMAEHIPSLR